MFDCLLLCWVSIFFDPVFTFRSLCCFCALCIIVLFGSGENVAESELTTYLDLVL